jgi:hypothetical protein
MVEFGSPSYERDDRPHLPVRVPRIDSPITRGGVFSDNDGFLDIEDRLPESGLRPPIPTVLKPHRLWMDDDIKVSILADAVRTSDLPRVGVFGGATVRDSFCVLIGDDGRLEHQVTREVGTVEFDAARLHQDLSFVARFALRRLVENPDSMLFNGIFQATVWAATEIPATTGFTTSTTAGTIQVATFDCEHVAVGSHNHTTIHDNRQQETARLSMARLIPGRPALVKALAHAIAEPGNPLAVAELDQAVIHAAAGMPEETMLAAAAADSGSAAAQVGLTGDTLTADGATAVAIGRRARAVRTEDITIDTIAVTGLWPDGQDPVTTSGPGQTRWNDLDWYLLDETGRLRRRWPR